MDRIYKYALAITDEQTIAMPAGARILSVQIQHGEPVLWAIVKADAALTVLRRILVLGTGHPADRAFRSHYIGTIQQENGLLVWHVFDGGMV